MKLHTTFNYSSIPTSEFLEFFPRNLICQKDCCSLMKLFVTILFSWRKKKLKSEGKSEQKDFSPFQYFYTFSGEKLAWYWSRQKNVIKILWSLQIFEALSNSLKMFKIEWLENGFEHFIVIFNGYTCWIDSKLSSHLKSF